MEFSQQLQNAISETLNARAAEIDALLEPAPAVPNYVKEQAIHLQGKRPSLRV
jgi:hypothetical protein